MCAHGCWVLVIYVTQCSGQRELSKQLKPAQAKAKAAAAAKAVAEGKRKAKATKESHDDTQADTSQKPHYVIRRHKRKVADGHVRIFAINSTQTGKQVGQLTEVACSDAENVVTGLVNRLNEGEVTLASALEEMNGLKA